MITKDNLNKYDGLFTKAEKVLKKKLGDDKFDGEITGIEEYFSYIDILAEYEQEQLSKPLNERDEGFDPIFTFLPVDEPMFDINLDKRTIDGSKFTGQQVVGDEIAEIIWFSVDRFFDATDLYNTEIFIQWEREVKNGEPERGLSPAFNKILSVKAEEGKMIFGWPLHSGITEKAGNVKFAVRFYTKDLDDEGNTILTYSLSTLQSTLKINPSLMIDISDDQVVDELTFEKNQIIYDRLRASAVSGVIPPAIPVIELDVYANGDFAVREADLVDGELKLNAKGGVADKAAGAGIISYEWVYEGKPNADGEVVRVFYKDEPGFDYVLSLDKKVSSSDIYYERLDDGSFVKLVDVDENANPANEGWYEIHGAFVAKQAGRYNVFAYNTFNNRREKSIMGKEWFVVPFAEKPNFVIENDKVVIGDDGSAELNVAVSSGDNGITDSYQWYYKASIDGDLIPVEGATDTSHIVVGGDNGFGTAANGYYALFAVNHKNNDSDSDMSGFIRVTEQVQSPSIARYVIERPNEEMLMPTPAEIVGNMCKIDMGDEPNNYVKIGIGLNTINSDSYTYEWKSSEDQGFSWMSMAGTDSFKEFRHTGLYKCVIKNNYNGQVPAEAETCHFVIY